MRAEIWYFHYDRGQSNLARWSCSLHTAMVYLVTSEAGRLCGGSAPVFCSMLMCSVVSFSLVSGGPNVNPDCSKKHSGCVCVCLWFMYSQVSRMKILL